MDRERNWAGNVVYAAARRRHPASVDELRALVQAAARVKVLGSRHSFSTIADTDGDHVVLDRLPAEIVIDADAATVTVPGSVRYGELAVALHAAGWGLANLASLPHISVAGACATATHGSGVANTNLAAAQRAVELVTGTGDVVTVARGDADFAAVAVGLGAFGAVTRVTLDVEPTYTVRQHVYEHLPFGEAVAHLDEILASAYSVSLFTTWRTDTIDQVWCKRRDGVDTADTAAVLHGAHAARRALHPIASLPADPCTQQLGVPGPWHERLPHFRMDFTPSSGDELQSELFVARGHTADALAVLQDMADVLTPVVQVSEVRTVAADGLWLSPACGRDVTGFHVTWVRSWSDVEPVLRRVEDALAPFAPAPHWGKLTTMSAATVHERYPRLADAMAVMRRYDPRGVFVNGYLAALAALA